MTVVEETEQRRAMVGVVGGKMGDVGRNMELVLNHYNVAKGLMANLLGVDKAVMTRCVQGRREFRASELFLLCHALSIPMHIVFLESPIDVQHALNEHDKARAANTKAERQARRSRA